MQMTEETLKLIQQTAVDAAGVTIHPIPGESRQVIVAQGTGHKFQTIPPPLRDHRVNSLSDLVVYAKWFKALHPSDAPAVVFHGVGRVVLVLNDADRRDQVVFPLEFSSQYVALSELLTKPAEMTQWEFIRLLRIVLGQDASVVDQFRKLEWETGGKSTGELKHGNAQLGNAIMAKVKGVEDLPDHLEIAMPVYANYEYAADDAKPLVVDCAVELNTHEKKLALIPLPNQLDKARDLTQGYIHADLIAGLGKDIPVFYGSPEPIETAET